MVLYPYRGWWTIIGVVDSDISSNSILHIVQCNFTVVCVHVCVWFSASFEQSISRTSTKSKLCYDNSLQIYANEPTL